MSSESNVTVYATVFRDLSDAKSVMTSAKSICCNMSFSMLIRAKQFSLSCNMVDRFGAFRSLNRENDLSPEQLLTIKERYMRSIEMIIVSYWSARAGQQRLRSEKLRRCCSALAVWV
jgi:hypothetical protein